MQHEFQQFEQVVQKINPDARLLRVWALKGGISAQMTALEFMLADGQTRKVIVRRPGEWTMQHNPHAATDEFRILRFVQQAGLKTPRAYLLDSSGEIFPQPYLVIEYIDGAPEYAPADPVGYAQQVAEELAKLHTINTAQMDLSFLPQQMPRLTQKLAERPAPLDHSLDEGRIREVLEAVWPLPAPEQPALLHGDFWPGNLLWKEGKLVAVVDWEDAEVGNPLADFAITRLDMLWILGHEAMHAFTRRYQEVAKLDFTYLPYWDLMAALRPASRISVWAQDWPELGRPDITSETMRAAHRSFVEQAFVQLAM
jgi:aminoglycoside phosphotransferase (APT) family kinase protein